MSDIEEALEWADNIIQRDDELFWDRQHSIVLAREYRKAAADLKSARADGRREAVKECAVF